MDIKDIINTFLEISFGKFPKATLKDFINKALDNNEYYFGFEIAIENRELDYQEFEDLVVSFEAAYADFLPNYQSIIFIFEKYLHLDYYSESVWIISDDGEIIISNGLCVAKIKNNQLAWITGRVSFDGINLLAIEDEIIVGEWYCPFDDKNPWKTLKIKMSNGLLIEGEIIEF